MRRLTGTLVLFTTLLLHGPAEGCGDKLLVLGRPLRFNSRPAVMLAFAPEGSFLASLLNDPGWSSAIAKGKHSLHIVQSPEQLVQDLNVHHYEVILVDVARAAALRSQLAVNPSTAVLAPVVDSASRDAVRTVEREYGIAIKGAGKTSDYLFAIGRAVDLHERKVEAAARERKNLRKNS